jgi:hypothetical protein
LARAFLDGHFELEALGRVCGDGLFLQQKAGAADALLLIRPAACLFDVERCSHA